MKLAIFNAMNTMDTGERVARSLVLEHTSVKATWDVPTTTKRYALEAKFRATIVLEDTLRRNDSAAEEAVMIARKQIATEVFGPLPDMASKVMYYIYDNKEVQALDELRKMQALMRGEDI
jgi:hypothetical protein